MNHLEDHRLLGHIPRVSDFAQEFIFVTSPRWYYLLFHALSFRLGHNKDSSVAEYLLESRDSCSLPMDNRASLESSHFKRDEEMPEESMVEEWPPKMSIS